MKDATGSLVWPKRLLSADDLRRHWSGQREVVLLPKTIITPLAADELRAKGVQVSWQTPTHEEAASQAGRWFYAQEKHHALVASAVLALERDGISLAALEGSSRSLAEQLSKGYLGGIVFSGDVAAIVCIANRIAGVRAAAVVNVPQTMRAKKNVGANLFAVEMPGPTFFEIRQMLKIIVTAPGQCSDGTAKILQELDGHAHR